MIIYNATIIIYDLCCFIRMLILRYRKKIPLRLSKLVVKKDKIIKKSRVEKVKIVEKPVK